jgi:diguanylate cyclase (GGDEF)-like protein
MATTYSKYRILISFGTVIALMAVVATIGLTRMAENNRGMETIVKEHNVKTRLLVEMHSAGRERSIILLSMLNIDDPFDRDDEFMKFNGLALKFIQAREKFISMPLNDQEKLLLDEQGTLTNIALPIQDEVIQLLSEEARAKASNKILHQAIPAQDKVMAKLVQMLEHQQLSAQRAMIKSNRSYQKTVITIGILSFFAICIAILIAIFVMRKTTQAEIILDRKSNYQKALLEWSRVNYQDDNTTITKATELSAQALNVERVSIWLFNEEKTQMVCADLYSSNTNTHESGEILSAKDYPEYFKSIKNGKIIVADNARKDPRTWEFNDSYLIPLDIYSMLDSPLIQDNELIGVICHEKTGEIKKWAPDEESFAGSMVNAVSLSLEIKKRQFIQEELKAQKETFHYHAHHDSLTNLPNRFLFNDRLNQTIKHAQRDNTKIALLFIDLDHFKQINDSMGHKIGDELLIEVAGRLKNEIRKADTLARLGGDEFSIILSQVTSNESIVEVTQNLIDAMNSPIELGKQSFYVTLSVGVAIYPDDGYTPDELLKNADAAMYQAKDEGRNTYQFYTQVMTEKAFERIAMETSFRHALEKEEFIVHYQPQLDAETEQIIGMEALVRWEHPEMGLISPAKFLSFAEDTGLIIPLDQWVMKTTMLQHAKWYRDGLEPGILALNLSIRVLQQGDFVDTIKQLLLESGCRPQWLELEVTEGQLMKDSSASIQILNRIKDLGLSLAIDDFGTGYSSLSQLKRLPINKLKLDRSFVRELPNNEDDMMISKTVIALSKNMGLSVIAEGVETQQQKDFLLQNGCHYIQGYYYSQPITAKDMEEILIKQQKNN